jgi:hypothetical protein
MNLGKRQLKLWENIHGIMFYGHNNITRTNHFPRGTMFCGFQRQGKHTHKHSKNNCLVHIGFNIVFQTTLLYESQWTSLIPTTYWSTSTS